MKFMVIILAIIVAVSAGCVEYGIDYAGHDVDNVSNVQSWQDCANHCKNHKTCQYWTWSIQCSHKCFLKSSDNGRKSNPGSISGKHDCTTEC